MGVDLMLLPDEVVRIVWSWYIQRLRVRMFHYNLTLTAFECCWGSDPVSEEAMEPVRFEYHDNRRGVIRSLSNGSIDELVTLGQARTWVTRDASRRREETTVYRGQHNLCHFFHTYRFQWYSTADWENDRWYEMTAYTRSVGPDRYNVCVYHGGWAGIRD